MRIMWDATNWVRECDYDLDKAIDYNKRGDLYFVLKQYRPLFMKYRPTEEYSIKQFPQLQTHLRVMSKTV